MTCRLAKRLTAGALPAAILGGVLFSGCTVLVDVPGAWVDLSGDGVMVRLPGVTVDVTDDAVGVSVPGVNVDVTGHSVHVGLPCRRWGVLTRC